MNHHQARRAPEFCSFVRGGRGRPQFPGKGCHLRLHRSEALAVLQGSHQRLRPRAAQRTRGFIATMRQREGIIPHHTRSKQRLPRISKQQSAAPPDMRPSWLRGVRPHKKVGRHGSSTRYTRLAVRQHNKSPRPKNVTVPLHITVYFTLVPPPLIPSPQ